MTMFLYYTLEMLQILLFYWLISFCCHCHSCCVRGEGGLQTNCYVDRFLCQRGTVIGTMLLRCYRHDVAVLEVLQAVLKGLQAHGCCVRGVIGTMQLLEGLQAQGCCVRGVIGSVRGVIGTWLLCQVLQDNGYCVRGVIGTMLLCQRGYWHSSYVQALT